MQTARIGDRVAIEYIGTLDNGRIFDNRSDDDRLEILLGQGEVFSALEEEIIGMTEGEVKNIVLPASAAYGERNEENILTLSRTMLPSDGQLRLGQKLNLQFRDGEEWVMMVINITDDEVTLDGNHPLAGCELTFALKLVSISPASCC